MRLRAPIAVLALVTLAACQNDATPGGFMAPSGPSLATQQDDHWIVLLNDADPSPAQSARELSAAFGASPRHVYQHALKGFSVSLPEAAAAALARNPRVRSVERDQVATASATQSGATWGLDRLDQRALPLNASFTYNNSGAGVSAYIHDTGIRRDHSEFFLSSTNATSRVRFGYDAFGGNGDDCQGHGTHVAGTVGGLLYGVAKAVSLVTVRTLDCAGSGSYSGIIAGIDWMVGDHAAGTPAVANMSLGGSLSTALNDAVQRAVNDGITMVVAAGNSTADACNYSPASAPNAITLGATASTDARASYSNFGNCVDFFAPGSSITSASNTSTTGTSVKSGTSMASPHAAGAAALYVAAYPTSTPAQVRDGLYTLTTKGIVTSSNSVNNHLLYTLDIPAVGSPPPNAAPTAAFGSSCSLLACNFTDQSTDSDGTIVSRAWNFGDGSSSTAQNPSRTYAAAGTYLVTLTVTDDDGASTTTSRTVTVASSVSIVLTGSARTKGTFRMDLRWTGSAAASMDIYRNGALVTTVANTGSYTDNLGKTRGTYTHRVCEAGTSLCSNTITTTF